MGEPTTDVFQQREIFREQLRGKVHNAFVNRKVETYVRVGNRPISQKAIDATTAFYLRIKNEPDDRVLNFGYPEEKPNIVAVDNPHDFKDLLEISYEEIKRATGWRITTFGISLRVRDALKHEFAHHVPGLEDENLKILYAVEFEEDTKNHTILFEPQLRFHGQTTVGTWRKMVNVPHDKSLTDHIQSGSKMWILRTWWSNKFGK